VFGGPWVGGGFVGGGFVAGGGAVLAGGADVDVRAGFGVDVDSGASAPPTVAAEVGASVRLTGVLLSMMVGILEGVRVTVFLLVGVAETRGEGVALADGVLVGSVSVGKGPMRASTVPARAVRVPSASECVCPESPNAWISLKMRE
jgi:hypothetical protein